MPTNRSLSLKRPGSTPQRTLTRGCFSTSDYPLALPRLLGSSSAPWRPSYRTSLMYACTWMTFLLQVPRSTQLESDSSARSVLSCGPRLSTWDTASLLKASSRPTARSKPSRMLPSQQMSLNSSRSLGYSITTVNLCPNLSTVLPLGLQRGQQRTSLNLLSRI